MKERVQICVEGIVQGVGFRPFVYDLATKNGLAGFVRNDTAGVIMEVEGERLALDNFLRALRDRSPPLAPLSGLSAMPCSRRASRASHLEEPVSRRAAGFYCAGREHLRGLS